MKQEEYLTIAQASELTGKHADTIRAFIKNKGIKTLKDEKGRNLIQRSAILEYYAEEIKEEPTEAHEEAPKPSYEAIDYMSLINTLQEQLRAKDELIMKLQSQNEEAQKNIGALAQMNSEINMRLLTAGEPKPEEEPQIITTQKKKKHFWSRNK